MAGVAAAPVIALLTEFSQYQSRVLAGLVAALAPRGVPVLALSTRPFASERTPSIVLDLVRERIARGVVALADASEFRDPALPAALAAAGTPMVTLGTKTPGAPRVHGDNLA